MALRPRTRRARRARERGPLEKNGTTGDRRRFFRGGIPVFVRRPSKTWHVQGGGPPGHHKVPLWGFVRPRGPLPSPPPPSFSLNPETVSRISRFDTSMVPVYPPRVYCILTLVAEKGWVGSRGEAGLVGGGGVGYPPTDSILMVKSRVTPVLSAVRRK